MTAEGRRPTLRDIAQRCGISEAAAFEKEHPGTKVKWIDRPADGYSEKLSADAAAGYTLAGAGKLLDIAATAVQEGVALVGLSILSGAYLALIRRTLAALRAAAGRRGRRGVPHRDLAGGHTRPRHRTGVTCESE
ncbi:extracellular solute-binding protein [Streptomyces acidiscabies]|uniref:extracellular solute-binding protein n=1 Tax=Streptomyces acidiscabies TaxID=42234 RepID=UPI0038F73469